jgi:thiol-disulfide isomerase/thioredoxin
MNRFQISLSNSSCAATLWCGHCKQFAPFYFEVGAHFARDQHVRVARIDVDTHRAAAARYNVTGRGLHSFTSQLNFSAFCGIGGALVV